MHMSTHQYLPGFVRGVPDSVNDVTLSISLTPEKSIKWPRIIISIIRNREIPRSDLEKLIGKLGFPKRQRSRVLREPRSIPCIPNFSRFRIALDYRILFRDFKMAGTDFDHNATASSLSKTGR